MKLLFSLFLAISLVPVVKADLCVELQLSERQIFEVQKEINLTTSFSESEKQKILVYANEAFSYTEIKFTTLKQFINYLIEEDLYSFDEFNFMRIQLKSSGERYTYIWNYPGDNEYGVWIDENNQIVGSVSDGDLSIGNAWCDYIDQE